MMNFEKERFMWPEPEHYNIPSDSESCGMRSQIIMRDPCMASVRHVPRNLPEQPDMPLAGFIYICDGCALRYLCRRKFLCLPATSWKRRQIPIARVRPGTKLFFLNLEARLLSGVYETTTFPQFPEISAHETVYIKVYFQVYKRHEPLEERVFRNALLEENYVDRPGRFYGRLSGDQVAALLAVYRCQDHRQCLSPYNDPFWRRPAKYIWQSQRDSKLGKLTSMRNKAMLSGEGRGTYKKHSQTQKQYWTNAQYITGANAILLNPRRKNYLPAEELFKSDVKLKIANNSLMGSDAAQMFSADFETGGKTYSSRNILEDGQVVALTSRESSSIDEDSGRIQEPESDSSIARVETRNFIKILEQNRTSASNKDGIFCTILTSSIHAAPAVQSDNNEAESRAEDRAVQSDAPDMKKEHIDENSQTILSATGSTGKHPFAPALSAADRGQKLKQSVWLRLADPTPSWSRE